MGNPYSRVIDELQLNQNWRGIVFAIAKFAPSAVLRAIDEAAKKDEPAWKKGQVMPGIAGNKIMAIKQWRAETGASLSDAKNAVEAL